jgi:hypothetical protein
MTRFTTIICLLLLLGRKVFARDNNGSCRKAIELTTINAYDSVDKTETGLRQGLAALLSRRGKSPIASPTVTAGNSRSLSAALNKCWYRRQH